MRQASEAQGEKGQQRLKGEKGQQRLKGEKMRNASGQRGENE